MILRQVTDAWTGLSYYYLSDMYTHQKNIITAGKAPKEAKRALVMIHGRGGSAQDIISLSHRLKLDDVAIYAPQATQHSWYPYSFMESEAKNQPALDSALALIEGLVQDIVQEGITAENIYFLGFSQGACLTLEYTARNAKKYGGVIAFTGGLIGKELVPGRYQGDFDATPIFISSGDPDPHIPVSRVEESVAVVQGLGANVLSKVYKGRPHTIMQEEMGLAGNFVLNA